MRLILVIITIVICFLCSSCLTTYGDKITRQYTPLRYDSTATVNPNCPILLYFENEPLDFDYVKVGLIEVQGNQGASSYDLLNHLKYEAWKNGGNAVINIKNSNKIVEAGTTFNKDSKYQYNSTVCTGIAVKINDTSLVNKLTNKSDTLFIGKAKQVDHANSKKTLNQIYASMAMIVILIGVVIYAVAHK